jgi:hypothetical protein
VEVARHEVNVVFRIAPYQGDNDPEKKSLQLCRGRDGATLRRPLYRRRKMVAGESARLEVPINQLQHPSV